MRMEEMRTALRLLRAADKDAFYAVVSADYATPAAHAVATCLAARADGEAEREMQTDPTPTVAMSADVLLSLKEEA